MSTKLIDASVASSEDSSVAYIVTPDRVASVRLFTIVISSAATVLLQGRMNQSDSWHTLQTYTATDAETVVLFPQMRTSMSGNDGTVNAWLDV